MGPVQILKGLPESYKPLAIRITQSTSKITFTEFKVQLRSFEETEKFNTKVKADQVMRTVSPTCYGCRQKGHFIKDCPGKSEATKCCSYHKSTTHTDGECRRYNRNDRTKQAIFSHQTKTTEGEHSFAFHAEDHTNRRHNINPTGLLVDTGATSTLSQLTPLKESMELLNRQNIAWNNKK